MKPVQQPLSVIFALFFSASISTAASWEHTVLPFFDTTRCIGQSHNILLTNSVWGITYSEDGGSTWKSAPFNHSTFSTKVVQFLPWRGDTVFAATAYHGTLLSTDNGRTWETDPPIPAVRQFFPSDSLIFARMYPNTLFCSADNGKTWNALPDSGLTDTTILSFTTTGSCRYAGTADHGVFRCTKDSTIWTPLSIGLPAGKDSGTVLPQYSLISFGDTIYSLCDSGIYRLDGDTLWTNIAPGLRGKHPRVLLNTEGRLLAGTDSGLYVRMATDSVWNQLDGGLPRDTSGKSRSVGALFTTATALYAGTAEGVYRSSDNGTSWSAANSNSNATTLARVGRTIFTGTAAGVFSLSPDATTWQHNPGIPYGVSVLLSTNRGLVAGTVTISTLLARMYYSLDSGTTWTMSDYTQLADGVIALAANDSVFIAGIDGFGGIYLCPDILYGWNVSNTGMVLNPYKSYNVFTKTLGSHGSALFAGTRDSFFRSDDNARTWVPADTDLAGMPIGFTDNGSTCFTATDSGIFSSSDFGRHWHCILDTPGIGCITSVGENIFAVLVTGIIFSGDNGSSWSDLPALPGSAPVTALAVFDGICYAAIHDGSVWRLPVGDRMTAVKQANKTTPCPAAMQVCLSKGKCLTVTLSSESPLSIDLFDLAGRRCAVISNQTLPAGSHTFTLERPDAAGIYTARIATGATTRFMRIPTFAP